MIDNTATDNTASPSSTRALLKRSSKIVGIASLSAVMLMGCNKKTEEESTEPEAKVVDTQPAKPAAPALDCNSAKLRYGLQQVAMANLDQFAQMAVSRHSESTNIAIDADAVRQKVSGLLVDVQDIKTNANDGVATCQASVSVTIPSEDMYRASQIYAAANQPALQQQLQDHGISLNNNMLMADNVTFVVDQTREPMQAKIAGQAGILQAAADIVASSALKSQIDEQEALRRRQAQAQIAKQEQARQAARKQAEAQRQAQLEARRKARAQAEAKAQRQAQATAPKAKSTESASQPTVTSPTLPEPPKAPKAPEVRAFSDIDPSEMQAPSKNAEPKANATATKPASNAAMPKLDVPNADKIPMPIIEEEGTY